MTGARGWPRSTRQRAGKGRLTQAESSSSLRYTKAVPNYGRVKVQMVDFLRDIYVISMKINLSTPYKVGRRHL